MESMALQMILHKLSMKKKKKTRLERYDYLSMCLQNKPEKLCGEHL